MNSVKTLTFASAAELPSEWDTLTRGNVFLERKNLSILERVNQCGQKYFMVSAGEGGSIITTYRHNLDLLTFIKGSGKAAVTMIGVPCSVSEPGFSIGEDTRQQAGDLISGIAGAKIVLNAPPDSRFNGFAAGRTLPSCRLDVRWTSFADYEASLRSHYRHEVQKTIRLGEKLQVELLPDNSAYDDGLHQLYLNVYDRSEYKLECLSPSFFREFPGDIFVFKAGSKPVGFVKAMESGKRLIFLFGGIDYAGNEEFRVYLNMLLLLLKEGIRRKVDVIDFGQTAEEAKLKLGCRYSQRSFHAGHSKAIVQWLMKRAAGFLSYRPPEEEYHVFKG